MPTDVVLPQMGLEVSEGTVVTLHVVVGAAVAEGDPLVEVETDKALTDVVAPRDGVVIALDVEVGDTVPVGATLLRLGGGAEAIEPAPAQPTAAPAPEPVAAAAAMPQGNGVSAATPGSHDAGRGAHRIRAAPVARRAAAHLGIPLERVAGTGPRGRITLGDVERAAAQLGGAGAEHGAAVVAAAGPAEPLPGARLEPMTATRRAIARRMSESQQIPQFALDRDLDATWLLAEKRRLSAEGPAKVGVNDLLLQALAEAVVRTPELGTSYEPAQDGGHPQIRRHDGVDIGLAVATERGLLVPVVRRAHERSLGELALERARLTTAARAGRLELVEMSGATVSLSSLASFGIDRFNAMLNPGESAIVAVGRTVERVVPRDRGLAVVPTLTLTLTLDHRVVDGATGAKALAELAELLEGGMAWRV